MMYQLLIGDSFEHISNMENESIDFIVTDPPYASLERHRAIGTTTRLKGDWFEIISNDKLKRYIYEFYRVLKPDTHCYIICDQETHYVVREAAIEAGFTWKKLIIWNKVNPGLGYSWRAQHEVICYMEKGKRKLNNLGLPDVLSHKRIRNGYPTEKPVALLRDKHSLSALLGRFFRLTSKKTISEDSCLTQSAKSRNTSHCMGMPLART